MTKSTNSTNKLTKRERRILIVALIFTLSFFPFQYVWLAYPLLDEVYQKALPLPNVYRAIAPPDGRCPTDLDKLKASVISAKIQSVEALPHAEEDPLNSTRVVQMFHIPPIDRAVSVWHNLGESCGILGSIKKDTQEQCRHAGEKLHKAAAELEKALADFEETRDLMWVLLYIWLVGEIFGFVVVFYFGPRLIRRMKEAKKASAK